MNITIDEFHNLSIDVKYSLDVEDWGTEIIIENVTISGTEIDVTELILDADMNSEIESIIWNELH